MNKIELLVKKLVDKQLEPYNLTMEDVIKTPEINGIPWYQYYKEDNPQDFYYWAISEIKKDLKVNRKKTEEVFNQFNLTYGLSS